MMQSNQQQSRAPPLSHSVQVGDSTRGGGQFYSVGNISGAASSSSIRKLSDQRRQGIPQNARAGRPPHSADLRSSSEDRNIGASVYLYHSKRNCIQGENCRFHHYSELPVSSSRTQLPVIIEQTCAPALESSSGSSERRPSHEERGAAGDAEREVRLARIVQDDAAHTFKKSISGCIVTFGAGAAIQYLVAGSHISTVKITGLPTRSTPESVSLLIDRRGIPPESFWVSSHDTYNNVCEVLVECRYAKKLVAALNGADMDGSRLRASVVDAGGVTCNPSYVLSIWWRAPSVSYVATYRSTASAESRARALNGRPMRDRRVQAIVQNVRNANLDVLPSTAVIVNGLPVSVTDGEVSRFAGTDDVVRQPFGDYDIDQSISFLEDHVRKHAPGARIEHVTRPGSKEDMVMVRITIDDGAAAGRLRSSLDGQRSFPWNGRWRVHTRLDAPVQYKLTIPARQYEAQKRQWGELASGGAMASLKMEIRHHEDRRNISIRIRGEEKEAVGRLKVRAEDLARGVDLGAWPAGLTEQFLDAVAESTGMYILPDAQTRSLKVSCEPAAILRAREEIRGEESRLARLETVFPIEPALVSYFQRQGITALKEELGQHHARLAGPRERCSVVVRGGEVARCAVERHMTEAATYRLPVAANTICPVCYTEACAPFRLGCGHVYCTTCAKHLLSSATENKTFPLLCIGDDVTCGVPVPIPTIRRFLAEDAMAKLFAAAFAAHVERHPDQLKYCRTAACGQVHSTSGVRRVLTCPSCFAAICTGCGEVQHEGRTCEEVTRDIRRKHDELNDAFISEQNYKRCPSCQVIVEKTEGCNHIECRCGVHFCWRCAQVFPRDEIYEHMTEAHGGYGIGEDIRPDVAPPIHRPRAYFEMRRRLEAYNPYFPPPQFDDYDRAPTPYAEPLQDDEVHALERYNILGEV